MSDGKGENEPEITRRFINNRESQIGTGNLAGLTFGQEKWKYPYEATVEHTAEHIRRAEGGFGHTRAVKDAVYGQPDRNPWDDGVVQGLLATVWPIEGPGHGSSGANRYTMMPTQEEFRKNSPPLPLFNKYTNIMFLTGVAGAMMLRYQMRMPMFASVHKMALQVTAYTWAGYQFQKLITMKNMGHHKMAVDFAERHSDLIYKQEAAKYGDPEILEHYVKMGGQGHTG